MAEWTHWRKKARYDSLDCLGLARQGYQVLAAADGETALNIYRRSKEAIDVVLLDIGLPKVAGGDVLLKIKNENPDVKVVIASGYLDPKLKSEIDRAGVKHFLSKPYRPDEVVRTLQSLIKGNHRCQSHYRLEESHNPAHSHIAFPNQRNA